MLITRKSNRPSDNSSFRSRFRGASGGAFALRQYLRCREEFYQCIVVSVVQICFVVFLLMFGRTMHRLFAAHGRELSNWVEIICLTVLLAFIVIMARRAFRNVKSIMPLRQEMRRLYEESRKPEEGI